MIRQGFDDEYVQRLCGGDPQTERHFSAYFGELIHIKARARRLARDLAEDIRQETFLRVVRTLRSPGGLRRAECLGAFVNSVCNNVLRERFRDMKRHRPAPEEKAPLPDHSPSVEARLITDERRRAVRRVIDALPSKDRDLLTAVLLEEHDKDDVCRRHGVSRGYLRVLLFRAKNEFRALYSERERTEAHAGGRATAAGPQAPRSVGL